VALHQADSRKIPLCRAEVSRAHSVLLGAAIRMAECMVSCNISRSKLARREDTAGTVYFRDIFLECIVCPQSTSSYISVFSLLFQVLY
jgi:hypothetical protein